MSEPVDQLLFEELAKRDVDDVILPPFCEYNPADDYFSVKAWGGEYRVIPDRAEVCAVADTPEAHDYFYVFLVNYLLSPKIREPADEWISEKDLVGGVTFFRGPHEIPTGLITQSFGNNTELLKEKCRQLGGQPLDMADCSYSFDVIASIRIALLYWIGDEDFPPEAKLLIDRSLAGILPLDVVYGLLCDACVRIAK